MLGSILVSYLIVQRLTKNTFLSLLTSFLVTIMPLGIFFGRNVQPEPPALFFMLLGTYFYLLWTNSLSKKHLLYASLFVGIAAIFKVTFLIVFIPWLFVFPYKAIFSNFRKKKSQFISKVVYFIIGLLPFLILRILFEVTIVDKDKGNFVFHFSDLLSSAFWAKRTPILKSFLADNFTWWFVTFAIIGLVFCLIKYRSKFSRFMIGFAISIPIYIAIVSAKIAGHSYYQMPFLFLVCALSAYFIYIIGSTLSSLTKVKWLLYVVLAILLFTIPSLDAANDRVWDTNFYGQDVIGGYIESQTISSDRMVTFSHSQTLAVCSYAHRRCGSIYNTTHLQRVEDIFNVNFIYVDAAYLNKLHNHKAFEYIQKNYKIDLVGAFKIGNSQLIPTAFLLRKGGTYNLTEVEQKQGHFAKEYTRRTSDPAQFFIIKND